MSVPQCKRCKAPCQKYGGIGGYSVQCKACNERQSIYRRASYARNHGLTVERELTPNEIYKRALTALQKDRDLVQRAIDTLQAAIK